MYRAGIDIGGTKVMVGFLDEQKRLVVKKKHLIPDSARGNDFLPWLLDVFSQTAAEAGIAVDAVSFCGIGVPGTVSPDHLTVLKAPNLNWENEPLALRFTERTAIAAKLVQDSRAAAWGEYMAGAGAGFKSVVCITLGTGIGTGIVMDGKIFDGGLACAGEIGHVPVTGSGRLCGCGQTDCLEKYAAGMGLDITAKELFGPDADTRTLFDLARTGDARAQKAIEQAAEMLGKALVHVVNLLSPDCLLFSGGLSRERTLYTEPIMRYIKAHSYALTAEKLHLGMAQLGEDAPMIGCALLPFEKKAHAPRISASIMCADVMNLGTAVKELEENRIDYIHFDIMDHHFVPNLMLTPEWMRRMRPHTALPFDVHIMAENPECIVAELPLRKGDICSVHYESTAHLQQVLTRIRETGATPAVALNPGTPTEVLRDVLDDIGMVLIMTVNPGFAGQKLIPQTLNKIERTRSYLDRLGYRHIGIEVDGNCSFENIPKMRRKGSDLFVAGTSSVFHAETTVKEAMEKIHSILLKEDTAI